jgi:hypothetical protein
VRVLVGRDRELEALAALVASRELAIVMITGEPGIGKTRLLEELATRMRGAGGTVGWGRAAEVGMTPAFWPWIQALAALEVPDDRAPSLERFDSHAGAAGRLARFGEVAAFLRRRAAAGPVALVLDDVHAADPSTLQLLEDVLPLVAGARMVVALAARDLDAERDVADVLARLQRGAVRLPLARLGAADVAVLVGERADGARVFELSEGNPLFVEELVASGGERLPALSSVRAVIRERVARLPAGTAALLAAAAVVGREFSAAVVADIAGAGSLDPAVRLGVVQVTAPDRYRFSHALVAEALADELDASERARLHLRAAQAIERHGADASALAHHLLEAGHLAAAAAVDAAERAADEALGQLAFEDAATLLARALDALGLAAPADRARRARLVCARAEALQHAGAHAAASALCDEAATLARELGDGALLARVALARGLEMRFGRTDQVLVEALREALGRDPEPATRAKLLARLAAAEQPAADPREPAARGLEAIELARTLPPRDRLAVMYVASAALVDYVEPVQLEAIHREVLELARGVDRTISVHTRLRLCFTALERLDRAAFDHARLALAAEAQALGLPRWLGYARMVDAMAALLDGRFADADRLAGEAAERLDPWLVGVHRVMARWVRTEPPDLAQLEALSAVTAGRTAVRAWAAAQSGSPATARDVIDHIGTDLPPSLDFATMVASAFALAGTRDETVRVHAALLPYRNRIALASAVGSTVFDLVDRVLLVLAAAAGRHDLVDEHALDALDVAARLGSPVWTARVRADWGDALARRGEATKAAEQRALALAGAERLGMPGIAARCRGAAAPAGPPPGTGERVTIAKRGPLWQVTGFGEQVHVKDSRGIEMLARLVGDPHRELHALDLAGGADTGDAGSVLDPAARARYRTKLAELAAERDEAESWGDAGRAARASAQIEALTAEIERAFGLGGRERKVGAASERARTNVQRRISHALEQIRTASPRLGEHLAATVRTGTYCCYAP